MRTNHSMKLLIAKKRDGESLTQQEIEDFVNGVVQAQVQDSQLGAMLMAIYLQGMSPEETTWLTRSMMRSGDTLSWPEDWKGLVVDKHSTGGVGDKISLPLAPALAACGLKVPMISGRGLGFTGGTLDKLESIPGFNIQKSPAQMVDILDKIGCCIVGQTETLVPADKILYATRDVSGCVESIPLISSSIISKKAAESLDCLVLDVKVGNAAFMKNENDARALAKSMVSAGNGLGIKTVAVLTRMDHPIGYAIGNALEVEESIHCLQNKGPKMLRELVCILGGHILYKSGKSISPEDGYKQIEGHLEDGSALQKFCSMMEAQGVDTRTAQALCDPDTDVFSTLTPASYTTEIKSLYTGFVEDINALECAQVCALLGAGRQKAGEPIDHAVGLKLTVSVGDQIKAGLPWAIIYHNQELPKNFIDRLQNAFHVTELPPNNNNQSPVVGIIS